MCSDRVFGTSAAHPSQTRYQQTNHRYLDERFAGLRLALVILAHSPIA
jgi:hypothetical protein